MEKLSLKTKDLAAENVAKLSALFPKVITEVEKDGKTIKTINADKLKELIGDYADNSSEVYELTWVGKQKSRQKIVMPINKTLRPVVEDSVDFENTENLYIEGDNFEVLKLLQESYLNKIKMIYIDPPYNTGNDFVYKDNFAMSIGEYEEETGAVDEEGNKLFKNTTTNGRFHSDWLSMMFERLVIARDLLRDDGVIFISIDDNEVANLRKICDDVFGEFNFITIISRTSKKGSSNGDYFSPSVDYILVYAKNRTELQNFRSPLSKEYIEKYKLRDEIGKYVEKGLYQASLTLDRSRNARYMIKCPDGSNCIPPNNKRWRIVEESYLELKEKNEIIFKKVSNSPLIDDQGNQSKWNVYTKQYLHRIVEKGFVPPNIFNDFVNSLSTRELKSLEIPFDFAKPTQLIKHLLYIISSKEGIILDFFSGSATTAHAVMKLNAEDGGNRKFIMVQLPEPTAEDSEAFKAGYTNICEIGKERIRRAAKKIQDELT